MQTEPRADISRNSRYFFYIATFFVVILMISDTVGSKLTQIGPLTLSATVFIFPISYIFGDILTEVYGYKASRKVIWTGFAAVLFMVFCYWFVRILPAASFWSNQGAYDAILGATPRLVLGSVLAYFFGELSNSYVLSKMKIMSNGRHLWKRTIGSTIVGEGIDTLIFITVVFAGTIPLAALVSVIVSQYLVKVVYEIVATPLTYLVVNKLKKAEGIDVYDRGISYNPFALAE